MRSYITIAAFALAASVNAAPMDPNFFESAPALSGPAHAGENKGAYPIAPVAVENSPEDVSAGPYSNGKNEAIVNDFAKNIKAYIIAAANDIKADNILNNNLNGNQVDLNALGKQQTKKVSDIESVDKSYKTVAGKRQVGGKPPPCLPIIGELMGGCEKPAANKQPTVPKPAEVAGIPAGSIEQKPTPFKVNSVHGEQNKHAEAYSHENHGDESESGDYPHSISEHATEHENTHSASNEYNTYPGTGYSHKVATPYSA